MERVSHLWSFPANNIDSLIDIGLKHAKRASDISEDSGAAYYDLALYCSKWRNSIHSQFPRFMHVGFFF